VKVLFFGLLRDVTGMADEEIDVPAGATLSAVFGHYAARFPALAGLDSSILVARNREFTPRSTEAGDGDEIAFLPPVSGGSSAPAAPFTHYLEDGPAGSFFALTRSPIDAAALSRRILAGSDGALVAFEGVVRDNTRGRPTLFLDYECYEPMAVKTMADLGRDIAGRHKIGRIAMVHRLGRMNIGETSVAVLVSAPHRGPAFAAALEGIDRLKKTVPVWKKEYFADGEVWVDGEWDSSLPGR
jgi:molybdopterin converting factor subunit 1